MNIHVARTPHFSTRFTHTCCQGQTGSLTVRPDTARCMQVYTVIYNAKLRRILQDVLLMSPLPLYGNAPPHSAVYVYMMSIWEYFNLTVTLFF